MEGLVEEMWFTRTDDSFRAWFQVVTSTGILRTGITSGSFVATVINPNDSFNISASVTQSLQKAGIYYFDIPSSFLTSSGPGEYAVSVEVNVATAPKVTTAFSDVLRVSYQDFDTIVSASIVNSSSIEAIVSGVWSASTSSFNGAGTMGYYQVFPIVSVSASISASVDVPSIVTGVWGAQTASFAFPGTMGYALSSISSSFAGIEQNIFGISSSLSGVNATVDNIYETLLEVSGNLNFTNNTLTQVSSTLGITYGTLLQVSGTINLTYDTLLVVSSSVQQISSSILDIISTLNVISSSVNNLVTSSLTSGSIASAVWDEFLSSHSTNGTTGLALQEISVRIHEIYQILGLELGSPMTVTQTLRTVAAISQSLSGTPTTSVTVTRL